MKAPRATCEGYLTLRTSPSSPPPMLRRYCFLVGTVFYYYSTQEDAYHMLRLKGEVDVLGVQEWDGKGNMHIYTNGFLFATAQNKVFYAYADTSMEKEKWMRAIQMTVETSMPRLAYAISHAQADVISPNNGTIPMSEADTKCKCPFCTSQDEASSSTQVAAAMLYKCHSCDVLYCEKFTTRKIPLRHCSYYYSKRVCDHCYNAQVFLHYLKAMVERLKAGICLYPKPLNPETPIELIMPQRPSRAAEEAIKLLKRGDITAEECEVLLMADRRFIDETSEHQEIPLDLKILALHREFRSKGFSVYRAVILLHRHLDSDPLLFKPVVEKLLCFSFTRINQVEFYWPQIVHAYLTAPTFDFEKIFWMDELILSICSRSIHLALLLRWQLQGALEDAFDVNLPKDMQDKYARVVRLMVQVEQEVVGTDRLSIVSRKETDMYKRQKGRLPMPTQEQLSLIELAMEEIAAHRSKAQANSNISYNIDALKETNSNGASAIEMETRFQDFSRFQQHLLTPKRDPSIEPMLTAHAEESKPLEDEDTNKQPTTIFANGDPNMPRRMSQAEKSVLAQHFADECDFVEQITDIAEALRDVPSVPERKKLLPSYLEKIRLPPMAYVPLVKATDPFERIVRIPTKEGTAFSTKARVPIMLIFEVIRGNFFNTKSDTNGNAISSQSNNSQNSHSNSEGSLNSTVVNGVVKSPDCKTTILQSIASTSFGEEYVEDEEVGRLIQSQRSIDGFMRSTSGFDDDDEEDDDEDELDASSLPSVNAPCKSLSLEIPETPTEIHGPVNTPLNLYHSNSSVEIPLASGTTTELSSPAASLIATTTPAEAIARDLDLSNATLSVEAIEREKDRRKDLESAFGESWSSKRKRLKDSSPYGHLPGWDIVSMIGKSNDDLRQEVFTLQLIQKFIEIFKASNLPIWLKCYRIIATSSSTGLIETLANAMSLDGLKKREGYVSLLNHFEKSYGPVNSPRFIEARKKYIQSMAGYSLVCYFLQIKDRHNGNIMLDNEGHIIHIDYGFLLGIAPGGSFSIETAPFKLTAEMVDTMGGVDSEGFQEYVTLCTRGFLACQKHCDELCDLVDVMSRQSPYPCFAGKDISYIMFKLRSRFKLSLSKEDTVAYVLSLIRKSNSNYSTRQYDNFQRMTNGILP